MAKSKVRTWVRRAVTLAPLTCLALGSAGLLTNCSGPRVKLAKVTPVEPETRWRTAVGTGAPIDVAWWQALGDPVLTGLVEQALAANPNIGMATARIRQAKALERQARSFLFPWLNGIASGTGRRAPNATGGHSTTWTGTPGGEVSYEVDLWGRIRDETAAEHANYIASKAARDTVRLSIASAVADAYVTLRGLDAELQVVRTATDSYAKSLALTRRQYAAGYTDLLAVRQAEVQYENANKLIPQIQLGISQTENAISTLLGRTPHDISRGATLFQLQVPSIPAVMPSELLNRRPDVAEAAYQLISTDKSLLAARKAMLPSINLNYFLGEQFINSGVDQTSMIWQLGGSILAPIFQGGRLRARADQAGGARDEAAYNYQTVALTAFQEAEDSLAQVRDVSRQLVDTRNQRDALISSYQLASRRYGTGYSSFLEQLYYEQQLLSAELEVVQTLSSKLQAYIQLYRAMGGGWSPETLKGKDNFDAMAD